MRKLSRSLKVIVVLSLAVALLSVALGAVIFTLTVNNTMRLSLTTGLVLRDNLGAEIASHDWGDFTNGQLKHMCGSIGDGTVTLVNQGNGEANVAWSANCPAQWMFMVKFHDSGNAWVSGTPYVIPVGGSVTLEIDLLEQTATGGVQYNFDLSFEQSD